MFHRIAVGSVSAGLVMLLLAGCGDSSATPSPSVEPLPSSEASSPAATTAPIVTTPPASPDATTAASGTKMTALCTAISVRKSAKTTDKLLVRLPVGATVRVVSTVTGDTYSAGTCGTGGDQWLKIDRVNGKSVKKLYGVSFGYTAAGFFQ